MAESMNYFVHIKDILGVETNMDSFSWSYGRVAPKTSAEEFSRCKIKVSIELCEDRDAVPETLDRQQGCFSGFWRIPGKPALFYEKTFLFGKKLRYVISVDENHIHVRVGKSYMRFVPLRLMNLHAMHYVLSDLVSGLLLMNGMASMYCSSVRFQNNDRCALIFSPPGMGKTVTCLRLCQHHNARFLAEDIAVTDGETVWAVPWTSSFRTAEEQCAAQRPGIWQKIKNRIPVPALFRRRKTCSAQQLLGADAIADCGTVTDLVLLERGKPGVSADREDIQRKMLLLNRYLFNYHKSPCMVVLSYFCPEFSPEKMYLTEKEIVKKLVSHADCMCVTEEDPLAYSDAIFENLKR